MSYVHSFRIIAAALALGFVVGVAAPVVAQITEENVNEMVEKATTAADHTALADYFRAQSQKAAAGAQSHRAMKLGRSGPKSAGNVWDAHCNRLIQAFQAEAAAYMDLAKEQDALAKHAATAH